MKYYLVNGSESYDGMEWLMQTIVIASDEIEARNKADKVMKAEGHDYEGIAVQEADGSIHQITKEQAELLSRLCYLSINTVEED